MGVKKIVNKQLVMVISFSRVNCKLLVNPVMTWSEKVSLSGIGGGGGNRENKSVSPLCVD